MSTTYDLISPEFWEVDNQGYSDFNYSDGVWSAPVFPQAYFRPLKDDVYDSYGYLQYAGNAFWATVADNLVEEIRVTGTRYYYGYMTVVLEFSATGVDAGDYTVTEGETETVITLTNPFPVSDLVHLYLENYGTSGDDPGVISAYTSIALVLSGGDVELEPVSRTFTIPAPNTGRLDKISDYQMTRTLQGLECAEWARCVRPGPADDPNWVPPPVSPRETPPSRVRRSPPSAPRLPSGYTAEEEAAIIHQIMMYRDPGYLAREFNGANSIRFDGPIVRFSSADNTDGLSAD